MTTDEPGTLGTVLKAGTDYLAARNVENPRIACELLAARLLGCKRLELATRSPQPLTENHLAAMRRGVKRVGAGEPVQYVIGETDFMGHTLKVDPRALIPRPETEGLVELVLGCDALWKNRPAVVDVGTGSGCIAISLAIAHPNALYVALDVSADAVALARENATRFGLEEKIGFACGELPDCIESETVTAIVANLPYIPTADCEQLPTHIRDHEPRRALDGGETGLSIIENVALDASIALVPGGRIFLEIGEQQGKAVESLLAGCGFDEIAIHRDLAGRDRYAVGRNANQAESIDPA